MFLEVLIHTVFRHSRMVLLLMATRPTGTRTGTQMGARRMGRAIKAIALDVSYSERHVTTMYYKAPHAHSAQRRRPVKVGDYTHPPRSLEYGWTCTNLTVFCKEYYSRS